MNISSANLPAYQPVQQTQNAPKPAVQHSAPPVATDTDGDHDGSGGGVNIKA